MYKLVFYVPTTHLEQVKEAVFSTGAGKIGNYDQCCWQVIGQGQYRPLPGSTPFLGKENKVESVDEYRVELVCSDALIHQSIAALKQTHPYEEPAYDVWQLADL
ncbi:MAG: NGG1p interacting factor NIF3 [Cellvibrionaceae bacterium]